MHQSNFRSYVPSTESLTLTLQTLLIEYPGCLVANSHSAIAREARTSFLFTAYRSTLKVICLAYFTEQLQGDRVLSIRFPKPSLKLVTLQNSLIYRWHWQGGQGATNHKTANK